MQEEKEEGGEALRGRCWGEDEVKQRRERKMMLEQGDK